MRALLQRRARDTSSRNVATRGHAREAQRARRVSDSCQHWSPRGSKPRGFDETTPMTFTHGENDNRTAYLLPSFGGDRLDVPCACGSDSLT